MYDLIYDFVHNELMNTASPDVYLGSLELILTHVGVVLVYYIAIMTIVYVFKLFAGLIQW